MNIPNNERPVHNFNTRPRYYNQITRTIHPVGQGAFYSERFTYMKDNSSLHLMVYDCGSNNQMELIQEISSSMIDGETINILFISHFDSDHVNGLECLKKKCKIEKVVMPLISSFDKPIYLLNLPSSLHNIVLDPQAFFGKDTTIIYVEPIDEDDPNTDAIDIEELSSGAIIESGRQLNSKLFTNWCYIPFNFEGAARREDLETAFQKYEIDTEKLEDKNIDMDYITKNQSIIKKAYQKVCTDGSNKSSLILYSGPIEDCRREWIGKAEWNEYMDKLQHNVACLYLGDTKLNQKAGKEKILDCLDTHLKNVSKHIGTIQVPHHGSAKNFNSKILNMWNKTKLYFASFGTIKRYEHPSPKVEEAIKKGNPFFGVTEVQSSKFIELIYL